MAGFRIPDLPELLAEEVVPETKLLAFDVTTDTTKAVEVGPALGGLLDPVVPPPGYVLVSDGTEIGWGPAPDTGHSLTSDYATEAGHALSADTAEHAQIADTAARATIADSAAMADEATHAASADNATTANLANRALVADSAATATTATHALTADSAATADVAASANYADTAGSANNANNALTANTALLANAAKKWETSRTVTHTGDATGTFTLDGSADVSGALTLVATGVGAGTYNTVTVDTKGRVTAGTVQGYITEAPADGMLYVRRGSDASWQPMTGADMTLQRKEIVATAGQTVFVPDYPYTVGYMSVYINGVRQSEDDFTATNGINVVLDTGAGAGDIVLLEGFLGSDVVGGGGGSGTVTSVDVSGGTTGLTTSGGPITDDGVITLDGTLVVANGGTGATSLTGYVKGNGTAPLSAVIGIPMTDITGVLPPSKGGTGATALTPGSVVFAGASGVYSQDNASFFWDDTNNRLGLGTAAPTYPFHQKGSSAHLRVETTLARGTGAEYLSFADPSGSTGQIVSGFGGGLSFDIANLLNGPMTFSTNLTERLRLSANGNADYTGHRWTHNHATDARHRFQITGGEANRKSWDIDATKDLIAIRALTDDDTQASYAMISYRHTGAPAHRIHRTEFWTSDNLRLMINDNGIGVGLTDVAGHGGSTSNIVCLGNPTANIKSVGGLEARRDAAALDTANAYIVDQTVSAGASSFWQLTAGNGIANLYMNATSGGVYMPKGGTAWIANSDERMKVLADPISGVLAKLATLRTLWGRYEWDDEDQRRPFLIAQDVQRQFPEIVIENAAPLPGNPDASVPVEFGPPRLGFAPTDMIPMLVAAVKELTAALGEANARIAALEATS